MVKGGPTVFPHAKKCMPQPDGVASWGMRNGKRFELDPEEHKNGIKRCGVPNQAMDSGAPQLRHRGDQRVWD
jgi:hypothetical protein